jgi:hypothetical protein
MYETKLHCLWEIFRQASLSQWRSLLAQCDREVFIISRILAKVYITQDAEFFPDTSSDT